MQKPQISLIRRITSAKIDNYFEDLAGTISFLIKISDNGTFKKVEIEVEFLDRKEVRCRG